MKPNRNTKIRKKCFFYIEKGGRNVMKIFWKLLMRMLDDY